MGESKKTRDKQSMINVILMFFWPCARFLLLFWNLVCSVCFPVLILLLLYAASFVLLVLLVLMVAGAGCLCWCMC